MDFQPNRIYHVFNQGNRGQRIFFEDENYLYFLGKTRKYLLPHADILCFCLMPNHFHFLLVPKESAVKLSNAIKPKKQYEDDSAAFSKDNYYQHKLNSNIGTMLSSYTKAINKRYGDDGSLFRGKTKAEDGWIDEVMSEHSPYRHLAFRSDNDYALQCFHHIHNNPVKAKLVLQSTDWLFSSARDYAGLRNGTLCNQPLAKQLLQF